MAIIITLYDMAGYTSKTHPWLSWHRNRLFLSQVKRKPLHSARIIRIYPFSKMGISSLPKITYVGRINFLLILIFFRCENRFYIATRWTTWFNLL